MGKFKSILLLAALFLPVIQVQAAEIPTYTTVTITAEVPEGFEGEIALAFTDEPAFVSIKTALVPENEYTSNVMLLSGCTYFPTVVIRGGDYQHDLEESYQFSGDEAELRFRLTDAFQPLPDEPGTGEAAPDHGKDGQDIDVLTGLETAESVFARFLETCSIMDGNPAFTDYLNTYSGHLFKQTYLEDNENNTEEEWEAMNPTQRYERFIASAFPKICCMNGTSIEDEKTYLDEVRTYLIKLDNIEGGPAIRDEVLAVWRWLHKYYLHTGTFYDFYENSTTPDQILSPSPTKQMELENTTPSPSPTITATNTPVGTMDDKEEIGNEAQETSGLVTWVKGNLLTLVILAVAGIALIATIIIKKKNLHDKD